MQSEINWGTVLSRAAPRLSGLAALSLFSVLSAVVVIRFSLAARPITDDYCTAQSVFANGFWSTYVWYNSNWGLIWFGNALWIGAWLVTDSHVVLAVKGLVLFGLVGVCLYGVLRQVCRRSSRFEFVLATGSAVGGLILGLASARENGSTVIWAITPQVTLRLYAIFLILLCLLIFLNSGTRNFFRSHPWASVMIAIVAGLLLGGNGPAEGLTAVVALVLAPAVFRLQSVDARPYLAASIACFTITVIQASTSLIARTDATGARDLDQVVLGLKGSLAHQLSAMGPSVLVSGIAVGVAIGLILGGLAPSLGKWILMVLVMLLSSLAFVALTESFSYISGWHHLPSSVLFSLLVILLGIALSSLISRFLTLTVPRHERLWATLTGIVFLLLIAMLFSGPVMTAMRLQETRAEYWDDRSYISLSVGRNVMQTVPFLDFKGGRMLEDIGQGAASIRFGRPYEVGYMEWCFARLPVGF